MDAALFCLYLFHDDLANTDGYINSSSHSYSRHGVARRHLSYLAMPVSVRLRGINVRRLILGGDHLRFKRHKGRETRKDSDSDTTVQLATWQPRGW